jgi:hypothetical protein
MFKAEEKKKKGKREEVEGEVWFVVKMVWIVIGRPARDPRHPPTRSTGGRAEGSHDLSTISSFDACASVQHVPCQAPVRPPPRLTRRNPSFPEETSTSRCSFDIPPHGAKDHTERVSSRVCHPRTETHCMMTMTMTMTRLYDRSFSNFLPSLFLPI